MKTKKSVPFPKPKSDQAFPDPVKELFPPHQNDDVGSWLILGDVHVPYHDPTTVKSAFDEAKKRKCVGVLLNGDFLDSHEISTHDKDPGAVRYKEEIEIGKKMLGWMRSQLPDAKFVYKQGNHEDRLERYVINRAPAIFGLENVNLASFLNLQDFGVEWVGDKRTVRLGRLNVVHGHEFRGGGGVNPARWLYLRTGAVCATSHFHRVSEHHEPTIERKIVAAWSIGCACSTTPRYDPNAKWQNGYALVDVEKDGFFTFTNRRLVNGRLA